MARKIIDECSKQYGYWKVLSFHDVKNGNARFKCECTNCKTIHVVNGFALRSGRSSHCVQCNHKGLD